MTFVIFWPPKMVVRKCYLFSFGRLVGPILVRKLSNTHIWVRTAAVLARCQQTTRLPICARSTAWAWHVIIIIIIIIISIIFFLRVGDGGGQEFLQHWFGVVGGSLDALLIGNVTLVTFGTTTGFIAATHCLQSEITNQIRLCFMLWCHTLNVWIMDFKFCKL